MGKKEGRGKREERVEGEGGGELGRDRETTLSFGSVESVISKYIHKPSNTNDKY